MNPPVGAGADFQQQAVKPSREILQALPVLSHLLPHLFFFKFFVVQPRQLRRQPFFLLQLQLSLGFVLFCLIGTNHFQRGSPPRARVWKQANGRATESVNNF